MRLECRRNSRGEWCACVPIDKADYQSVHHVRLLVPIPETDKHTTSTEAKEQLSRHIDEIKEHAWMTTTTRKSW